MCPFKIVKFLFRRCRVNLNFKLSLLHIILPILCASVVALEAVPSFIDVDLVFSVEIAAGIYFSILRF
jgi:hypothetical protein